ncbi:hypothetical protein [Citrobacter werkmanii]|uniref:hypothetical protein n=1 Tax=Citrobacter werkmanii TaxID=67827 RepID=UPI00264AE7D7|nr:hypothetical protein [Citrobacter werkmanii]MDN8559122.1 hypothetical protein [Citrobacter werkmanii]
MSQKLMHRYSHTPWTLEHLRFLERHYRSLPLAELAESLGRSPGAVALMADKLGCRGERGLVWTEAEMDVIRCHYGSGVGAEFLQQLLPGRTVSAIFTQAEKMGVLSGRFWNEEEREILKAYYPTEGTMVTARLAGRTVHAVRIMAKRLGLKKSQACTTGFRPWSDEEWRRLENSLHMSSAEQQATHFPTRTLQAVEKARERFSHKRRPGPLVVKKTENR